MDWVVLVLIRAFCTSCKETSLKFFLGKKDFPVTVVAAWTTVVPVVILMPYVLYDGQYMALSNPVFFGAIIGNVVFNIIGHLILMKMIKRHEISYISAIGAASPFFYAFFAFILIGEILNFYAILFMSIIISGAIILEFSRQHISVKRGASVFKGSAWPYMLVFMICAAIATVFSKIAVTNGPVEGYIAFRYLLLGMVFTYLAGRSISFLEEDKHKVFTKNNSKIAIAGLFLTIAVVAEMYALKMVEISIVDALTKISLVLTFILEIIFIRRHFNLLRLCSIVFILIGSSGLILFS